MKSSWDESRIYSETNQRDETKPYVLEPASTISFSLDEERGRFEAQISIRKKIKNNSLLFRVKTSARGIYVVHPRAGYLSNNESKIVKIEMRVKDASEERFYDKFLVQFLMASNEVEKKNLQISDIIGEFDKTKTEDRRNSVVTERLKITMKFTDIERAAELTRQAANQAPINSPRNQNNDSKFQDLSAPSLTTLLDKKNPPFTLANLSNVNLQLNRGQSFDNLKSSLLPNTIKKTDSMSRLRISLTPGSNVNALTAVRSLMSSQLKQHFKAQEEKEYENHSEESLGGIKDMKQSRMTKSGHNNFIDRKALSREDAEKSYEEKVAGLTEKAKKQEEEIRKISEERSKHLNELNKLKFTFELEGIKSETGMYAEIQGPFQISHLMILSVIFIVLGSLIVS